MYRKLRIGLKDIWKLLFGGKLLIKNPYDNDIAREEVAKAEVEVCSTATVTSAETEPILKALPYTEANFRALETNYQNLLGEYEDMCAVTKMKDKENDALTAKVHVLIPMLETVIRFLIEPFKEQLPSDTLEELANVERYLEGCKNEYSSCSKSA